ncbi:NAD-dependent epimerase/dehydratase family protein [Paracoccus sp. (in: a-proteobacteria)]|uniref:NAD-dependent epimerase/dehydratase family protein n=1 Tax=Paracoccus sp. TaxID=267 RepID=UPI0026DEE907|nr:NAD-dependent epimerase/dehydratase family protein [Paracoccus sp. (in: a-proteobacteria)]MDO5647205.1 NAD-dependent epimerase/dehydratase family protein [Paracoccus sp. (in: a-proteobacteria)]
MTARFLVTGGAGFIGGHLVAALLARGDQVVVVDDLSTGRADNVPQPAHLVRGDIRDAGLMQRLVAGADRIIHLAACVSVQHCIQDWTTGHSINLGGTITVFQAAQRAGNVPVIYASSAAVYGDRGDAVCAEGDVPAPISPYGADKLGCEHQARAMAAVHGVPSVGLRFFNVYGPGQSPDSSYAGVISRFCDNRRAGRPHTLFGDGGQTRDFIHVRDIVAGILRAADVVGQGAQVFNLCGGRPTSLLELAAVIDAAAGAGATPLDFQDARAGDIRHSRGCDRAAQAGLGFAAHIPLDDGIADLWRHLNGSTG